MNRTTLTRRAVIATLTAMGLEVRAAKAQSGNWIVGAIYAAAARYGVSGDWLLSVAMCESGLDPNAIGPHGEIGIFQFWPGGVFYDWGGTDIYNTSQQIEIAAWAFANGYSSHWVCAG